MEIIRDDRWNTCLLKAQALHGKTKATVDLHQKADAIWRLKARYQEIRDAKKTVKILDSIIPPPKPVSSSAAKCTCSAITLSGKKCQFKTINGTMFCKKHQLKGNL